MKPIILDSHNQKAFIEFIENLGGRIINLNKGSDALLDPFKVS
jgi:hypothetical protein